MSGSYFGGTPTSGTGFTELLQFSGKLQYVKQGLNLTSFAIDRTIGHLAGNVSYIDNSGSFVEIVLPEVQSIVFNHIDQYGNITDAGSTLVNPTQRFVSFTDNSVVIVGGNDATIMKMYYDVVTTNYCLLKDFDLWNTQGNARDHYQETKSIRFPNMVMIGAFSILAYTSDMGSSTVEYFGVSKFGEIGCMYEVQ